MDIRCHHTHAGCVDLKALPSKQRMPAHIIFFTARPIGLLSSTTYPPGCRMQTDESHAYIKPNETGCVTDEYRECIISTHV
jgi:hypothetical protein